MTAGIENNHKPKYENLELIHYNKFIIGDIGDIVDYNGELFIIESLFPNRKCVSLRLLKYVEQSLKFLIDRNTDTTLVDIQHIHLSKKDIKVCQISSYFQKKC